MVPWFVVAANAGDFGGEDPGVTAADPFLPTRGQDDMSDSRNRGWTLLRTSASKPAYQSLPLRARTTKALAGNMGDSVTPPPTPFAAGRPGRPRNPAGASRR